MKNKTILVIGSSNTDMTVLTETLPAPGETLLGGEFKMGGGGKGANQAVAAKRLGGDVQFICKVGRDIFGENAIASYKAEGLDTSLILRSEKPSGVALILVDKQAENCISVAGGANEDFSVEDIRSLKSVIEKAGILILQHEIPIPSIVEAAKIAHAAGAYVILNPAPARALPEEIYACIDLLTPNQTETATMTGLSVSNEEEAAAAAAELRRKGVGNILMTMGGKGSMCFTAEESFFTPALRVKAIDTTAAGDTFCGALAVALAEGKSLKEAAVFATKASSLTVQRRGAQDSLPYRREIDG